MCRRWASKPRPTGDNRHRRLLVLVRSDARPGQHSIRHVPGMACRSNRRRRPASAAGERSYLAEMEGWPSMYRPPRTMRPAAENGAGAAAWVSSGGRTRCGRAWPARRAARRPERRSLAPDLVLGVAVQGQVARAGVLGGADPAPETDPGLNRPAPAQPAGGRHLDLADPRRLRPVVTGLPPSHRRAPCRKPNARVARSVRQRPARRRTP
jgi:hypothetical protein